MKSKSLVVSHCRFWNSSFKIDFVFDNNLTLLMGDSGTGKSIVYSLIKEMMVFDERFICFNYRDSQEHIKNSVYSLQGKLIVIDNADIILDDEIKKYISTDARNQYLLIGRNPKNLFATADNYYELISDNNGKSTVFSLKKYI